MDETEFVADGVDPFLLVARRDGPADDPVDVQGSEGLLQVFELLLLLAA